MKKYIFHLLAATLLVFFAGCSKDDGAKVAPSVVGEWHLATWNGETPTDFDVYMELLSNGSFNIYQKVETSLYVHYTGSFSATDNQLTGRYSDGVAWSSSYTYEISGETMTLTSTTSEVSVYKRSTVPDEVRAAASAQPSSRTDLPRFL
ncbi:lipocalin family protein [uncultured Alistipes sp.]|uniref:lipocalin family protein n=1 Tax=uncultured Alistipes sp. TaxID=538949 RepID=UPI00280394C2|nr:lipocalin family protein [uncultured Alistipes sp.]